MKTNNGPAVTYELVYKFFPVDIYRLNGGFMEIIGKSRGVLVRSDGVGGVMHHYPEDYLCWRPMRLRDE